MQHRVGPRRPLGAPHGPEAPGPVTAMLTPTVAQMITEDRIREAEARRIAKAARPPRSRAAGAPRLRRPAWPFAGPRTGATTR